MPSTEQLVTFKIGVGSINPVLRVQNGEIQQSTMIEAARRLETEEFYDSVNPTAIPNKCVDGRGRADGQQELGPNAAGGTFSAVMADALTTNRYRLNGKKAPQHADTIYTVLSKNGYIIGGHDAETHAPGKCGCGAQDELGSINPDTPSILEFMHQNGDDVRAFLASRGIQIDDATHEMLVSNAGKLIDEGYATTGEELRDTMKKIGGESSVEPLTGKHNEFNLSLNTVRGTTLNRDKLRDAFGDDYQTFNLDVWALDNAAKATAITEAEAAQKFAAMLYYNVSTAAVLSQEISVTQR